MRIIIAEDDTVVRMILQRAVLQLGHECLVSADGQEAWQLFQTNEIDVIISDWLMPRLDGIELCRLVRAAGRPTYTYFIFSTSRGDKADRLEGIQAGADDYLSKPLDLEELRVRLVVAARVTDLHRQLIAQQTELEQARVLAARKAEQERLLRAEAAVRHQLNRDLHDGPTQAVAAMAMQIEFIKKAVRALPERAEEELDLLADLVKKTYQDLRTRLFELRPLGLETHGLVPTLHEYALKFRDPSGMQVVFDPGNASGKIDAQVAASLFMIIQEAINNARKHAKASSVWIRLQQDATSLTTFIRDDGVGFDLASLRASYEARGSFGLLTMHERAAQLGGSCDIQSAAGAGTQLTIHMPLSPAPASAG